MALLCDTYGFLLPPLAAAELQARGRALAASTQAKAAWDSKKVSCEGGDRPRFLKQLIRQGIPAELRPDAWFWLSGGIAQQQAAGEGAYRRLSSCTSDIDEDLLQRIEQDISALWSSFRQHKLFQSHKGSEALTRMLCALLQHNERIGYSRGIGHMAALLLVVMGLGKEEQAFWTLVAMLQDRMFDATQGQVSQGARLEAAVLEQLVARKCPQLLAHLSRAHTDIPSLTTGWFASLFTTVLPPETLVRVWDCFVSEGSKVALRVALALLKKHEAVVLGCTQGELTRKVLELRASRAFDADELLTMSFNGLGSLPGASVAKMRAAALHKQQLHHQQQLLLAQQGGAGGAADMLRDANGGRRRSSGNGSTTSVASAPMMIVQPASGAAQLRRSLTEARAAAMGGRPRSL